MKLSFALILLLVSQLAKAQQTPFTAIWSFENTDIGASSDSRVGVSSVSYVGVNKLFGGYQSGYSGLGVSLQHWSTTSCDQSKYAQFSIQPQGTARITLTSLSFACSRSSEGPQQLTVRSSVDGFNSDIYSQTVSENYQIASITLSGDNFTNQTSEIIFRIYGCSPASSNGTLRLDQIQLNGQALPVSLVSFSAKPQGDQVQISWETAQERNADWFEVQRSNDLGEFITFGQIAAKGTTDQHHYYGFTDQRPLDGANYYRLKQIDRDGQASNSKIVAVVMDEFTPSMEVLGNPIDGQMIRVTMRNMAKATFHLTTLAGHELPLETDTQSDGSILLKPIQPLAPGIYLLRAELNGRRLIQKVVVR
ncbi:T9SS type A sorting domain-containing protein [Spirosoma aureum]|uniref:T9SS type A sorting domain-containing protein n=1 Tax=Spirosoma aureum TaxID=2692134 RepID=A0A6G9AHT3_9BACT|nr:T9SS type A sorting domain-containing protein [Spirosoma aureum]QIP11743.1 T9SS type A sorting domain-containing protein [Spirosoma aureum]